jgi:SOS-response transcriptional repressor LexA
MQLRLTLVMDTLATRVRTTRKFRGLTQAQLAKASGANQSDISKIERGEIERTTHIIGLASALGCDPRWLDTGDGPPPWSNDGQIGVTNGYSAPPSTTNTTKGTIRYNERRYPLLSKVQAGSWGVVDIDPGEIEDYVLCPLDLGERGFCLRVDGDSMTTSEGQFSFPDGMNVCFKAGEDAVHKDFVCVVREGESNALFKQLLQIDGKWFLHSLNPQWPTKFIELQDGDRITGKLKYAGWQF